MRILLSATFVVLVLAPQATAHIDPELFTGRAAVALVTLADPAAGTPAAGLAPGSAALSDTGPVATDDDASVVTAVASEATPAGSAEAARASVVVEEDRDVGERFRGVVTSEAVAAGAAVALPPEAGVGTVEARGLHAFSQSSCAGASGFTELAFLAVGGMVLVDGLATPPPNTAVALPDGSMVVLNEQSPVPGSDAGLTVNAVHVIVPGAADVVLGSASSAVFTCGD